jgi:hypothetical protein
VSQHSAAHIRASGNQVKKAIESSRLTQAVRAFGVRHGRPCGVTLTYGADATDPTTSSTSITSGNTLTLSKSQVLKVRAWATGLDPSAVRRADYMITGAVAAGSILSDLPKFLPHFDMKMVDQFVLLRR